MAGADVEDWGTLLLTFDDGTVAQITGGDTVLGGIRNQLGVRGACYLSTSLFEGISEGLDEV